MTRRDGAVSVKPDDILRSGAALRSVGVRRLWLAVVLAACLASYGSVSTAMAEAPFKLVPSLNVGWEVNKLNHGIECDVLASECQQASKSSRPGGLEFPWGVAGTPTGNADGDFFVADQGHHRIQEFTATGEFVMMIGKEVNETMDGQVGATETEKNVCTAASKDVCKAGVTGGSAGELNLPESIAVEEGTENIYVEDEANSRVVEYTKSGGFVLMIGKEVDETMDEKAGATEAEKNLCTASSKDVCKAGVRAKPGSKESAAFAFLFNGELLANANGLLYVANEQRVEIFSPSGVLEGEIPLAPSILASAPGGYISEVAVSDEGVAYVVYEHEPIIHEFGVGHKEIGAITLPPREPLGTVTIHGIAPYPKAQMAIVVGEQVEGQSIDINQYGLLYDLTDLRELTAFTVPGISDGLLGVTGISLNANGDLFAAIVGANEVHEYRPVPVAEVVTAGNSCKATGQIGSDDTFECELKGTVNPYDVANTETWFEWGNSCSALVSTTQSRSFSAVEEPLSADQTLTNLRPNEFVCYRLAAVDENVKRPEQLTGERTSFRTPAEPPRVLGTPSTSFLTAASAVLEAEVNAENTDTDYYFEYALEEDSGGSALEACPITAAGACEGVGVTVVQKAEVYGPTTAIIEAAGLQSQASYKFRLSARNSAGFATEGVQGRFETRPVKSPELPTPGCEETNSCPPPPGGLLAMPPTPQLLPLPTIHFPIFKPPRKCRAGFVRSKKGLCVKKARHPKKVHKARKAHHG